jgi:hypothetical protein
MNRKDESSSFLDFSLGRKENKQPAPRKDIDDLDDWSLAGVYRSHTLTHTLSYTLSHALSYTLSHTLSTPFHTLPVCATLSYTPRMCPSPSFRNIRVRRCGRVVLRYKSPDRHLQGISAIVQLPSQAPSVEYIDCFDGITAQRAPSPSSSPTVPSIPVFIRLFACGIEGGSREQYT